MQKIPASHTALMQALTQLAVTAKEQARLRMDLHHELANARHVLAQFSAQQETILHTTTREMTAQYHAILGYANYLDESVQRHSDRFELRQDFDDVCESAFNLKLIAGAIDLLRRDRAPQRQPILLADLMQHTLLALAPSLDRRAMKLTTIEVDASVKATTDAAIVSHGLWMMLLGIIRYAAEESTLRMRCFYDQSHHQAMMSIVVSELAPGAMAAEERGSFLARQREHGAPHLFAEAIRMHANLQLAELLFKKLDAEVSVVPLSSHACEICLMLPV